MNLFLPANSPLQVKLRSAHIVLLLKADEGVVGKIQILLIPWLHEHYFTSQLLRFSLTTHKEIILILKLSFLIS